MTEYPVHLPAHAQAVLADCDLRITRLHRMKADVLDLYQAGPAPQTLTSDGAEGARPVGSVPAQARRAKKPTRRASTLAEAVQEAATAFHTAPTADQAEAPVEEIDGKYDRVIRRVLRDAGEAGAAAIDVAIAYLPNRYTPEEKQRAYAGVSFALKSFEKRGQVTREGRIWKWAGDA